MKYRILFWKVLPYDGTTEPEPFKEREDIMTVPPKLYGTFEEAKAANVEYWRQKYDAAVEAYELHKMDLDITRGRFQQALEQKK